MKTIVLLASLDTKPAQADYLRQRIEERGFSVVLIDIGYGGPPRLDATITAEDVARAAGTDIASVRQKVDTGEAATLMTSGAIVRVNELLRRGECDGIVSFGGASNTTVATSVMQTVPVGIPKVMVSSAAAIPAYAARYFGSRDITMINSLADFSGLNQLTRTFLAAAAGAVCGMVETSRAVGGRADNQQVAVTGFRFSEVCTRGVIARLEDLGYTAIPFHAQGVGENALEDLVAQGLFVGVIDVVPAGLSEHLLGGNRAARADRLEAAGRLGIPQVIAPSGFDMISCGPLTRRDTGDPLWERRDLASRPLVVPDRFRVEVRTTAEETAEIGHLVADKLGRATGPARMMIPLRGWSSLSTAGEQLHDPEADRAFVDALHSSGRIDVHELDLELNSEEFAGAMVDAFEELIAATRGSSTVGHEQP